MVTVFALFAPLFGAIITGLFFRLKNSLFVPFISIAGVGFSVLGAICIFYNVNIQGEVYNIYIAKFLQLQGFTSWWSLQADGLTSIMLVVVTVVSLLVHIYSVEYMKADENRPKFMAFLSFFTFFMLVLVTSRDFIQMFVGWEGVGLCSYLLIGFWNEKESANRAAIKAFITNRVADLAFILGMCVIYFIFGSLDFAFIKQNISTALSYASIFGVEISFITLISICLFIGCMGKSAQIFLHVWLPDAMEGPTPVSALIHAATMVTAGVFLLAKCSFIFEYSDSARDVITIVGSITALFAATIALRQNDIKKIIAYSTCSQLGYMFAAAGLSAYNASIFHLATHAFFKALLFLGAGSVIHALSGEQNIDKMGGLASKIPFTFICMLIGSIAIAGIPPLSGFFSKDSIIEAAFMKGTPIGYFSFILLLITAFLTTFYSWRLLIRVFSGKETRSSKEIVDHIHESPKIMLVPLGILCFFAIFAGIIFEYIFHILSSQKGILANSITLLQQNDVLSKIHHIHFIIKYLPLLLTVLAIWLAYAIYVKGKFIKIFPSFVIRIIEKKYYIDEMYSIIFIKPLKNVSLFFIWIFDKKILDRIFTSLPQALSLLFAAGFNKLQAGRIVIYFSVIMVSMISLFIFLILQSNFSGL